MFNFTHSMQPNRFCWRLLVMAFLVLAPIANAPAQTMDDDVFEDDIFADIDMDEGVVEIVEPEPVATEFWADTAAPIGLILLFFIILLFFRQMVPFKPHREYPLLHDYPTGVVRAIAMASLFYGIAFGLGAYRAYLGVEFYEGTSADYFANMDKMKLVGFSHAHLFGFTTSFLIIGIPFTLNFAHIRLYQLILPIGLTASFIDVASWWGIKYISPNFIWASIFCATLFTLSYMIMLIGLLRVSLFPGIRWRTDRRERPDKQ